MKKENLLVFGINGNEKVILLFNFIAERSQHSGIIKRYFL
jgi:hypothetical protein